MSRFRRTHQRAFSFAVVLLLAHTASAAAPAPCAFDAQPAATPNPKALNVLLIGANGMIGSRILKEATKRGHCVTGASRHPDKIASNPNVRAVMLDATDKDAVLFEAKKADVIVSATSPRGGGDPMQEAKAVADAEMAAAKAAGKRLVIVGSAGSLRMPDGRPAVDAMPPRNQDEANAMRAVLDMLRASDIDWSFFCPPLSIAPGKRTGAYRIGTGTVLFDTRSKSAISAEDFAYALVDELESGAHRRAQMTVAY